MQSHVTVLTDEAVEALAIKNSQVIVDATFGAGGHAQKIVSALSKTGTFVGIDTDPDAIKAGNKLLVGSDATVHLVNGNFRDIDTILANQNLKHADGILADLGWRMEQFSGNGRGFSFQIDEDLIMTYGDPKQYPFVAKDILNEWEEADIKNVLTGYGEERFAGRIAHAIVTHREVAPFNTTFELVEVIQNAVPAIYKRGRINPATKTFQALRIAVNDEFDTLETFITKSVSLLKEKGRLAIITFHSLEDRIVKHRFKELAHDQVGTILTKKPIKPSEEEITQNPRSRSAKLRVFEKNAKT